MAAFTLPTLPFAADAWGPTEEPEEYKDVPFAPFDKSERLGRVADYGGFTRQAARRFNDRNSDVNSEFAYRSDAGEGDEFQVVDTTKAPKRVDYRKKAPATRGGRGGIRAPEGRPGATTGSARAAPPPRGATRGRGRGRRFDTPQRAREPSVPVMSDWPVLENVDLSRLSSLAANAPEAEDLKWAGTLAEYNESLDRTSTKTAQKIKSFQESKDFSTTSTRFDPVMQEMAQEGLGTVFATDQILAHIMTSARSVFPWDIVITYASGLIFLDVRDTQAFDAVVVNETAMDPPVEDDPKNINGQQQLTAEATSISQNLSQQILKDPSTSVRELDPHPFWDAESKFEAPASCAYRYRKFELSEGTNLIARCQVNALCKSRTGEKTTSVFVLNEWDARAVGTTEWRRCIDSQRGAVFATELKNNAFKISKWAAQSMLSGVDQMRIGYVSRNRPTDNASHSLLAMELYYPRDFAHQVSLNVPNMWGILKWLIECVRKHAAARRGDQEEASFACKFLLLKHPTKPSLTLYEVPFSAFEPEEQEEEGEPDWSDAGSQAEGDE